MRKFWVWFERLNELRRFLLVLLFAAVGFGMISLGFATEKHNPYLVFGGFLFILLLFLSRIHFLKQEAASRGLHIRSKRP